jgi:hypothetical protein
MIAEPSPWTWWESLCLFDVNKADQRHFVIQQLAKASSKITELKQFRLVRQMTDPISRQRGRPTSIKQ